MNRLSALRVAARAILWIERLAVALWAPLAVLAAGAGMALLGPGALLGPVLPAGLIAAVAFLLFRNRRGFSPPGPAAADRWLEAAAGLRHQPLAVIADAPALPGEHLWAAHQARARAGLARLRLAAPRPGLAAHDPFALRFAALLLLAAGLAVAGADAPSRLGRALLPGLPGFAAAAAPVVQAWIEPPSYTGMEPLFLAPGGGPGGGHIAVPSGARLTVSVGGSTARPWLTLAGRRIRFHRLAPGAWQADTTVIASGRLRIRRWFGLLGRWDFDVLPNTPPDIAWAAPPGRAGSTLETRLPWRVAQRWGVATLTAALVPDGHPDLPPLSVPIALPGAPKTASGAALADLAASPYAGLPMRGLLRGTDVSGQAGQSEAAVFTLPARAFHDPLAQAVVELRRRLALHPAAPHDAADDLDALAGAPEGRARRAGVFLNLSAVAALLRVGGAATEPEAQARLWTLALDLDGALPDAAEQKLAAARDALRRALAERAQGRIGDAELARKMEALRQALAQRLADLARKAFEKGQLGQYDPRGHSFASPTIDRMIRDMQQAASAGHMDEARRQMAELENLLDRLNNAKVLSPEQAVRAAEASRQARQLMGATADLARREAGLMDNAQARTPRPPPIPPRPEFWGQNVPPPPLDPGRMEQDEAARGTDARTERALERALSALQQSMRMFGAKPSSDLDAAGQAMQRAEQSLMQGAEAPARAAEGEAVQDLQKGGQQMARQMQQGTQMAIAPGGAGQAEEEGAGAGMGTEPAGQRDPLGRPVRGTNGRAEDDGSVRVPTDMEQGRSRAIQEELRRRDADRARPQPELDYIERLLRPY